ncbi:MAG: PaaI family thioesterase, partial [Candidatus Competibacteraceae bacterium]|nr:PaaI family thioesterase [Candidatus Competibacteraceae bacterium]
MTTLNHSTPPPTPELTSANSDYAQAVKDSFAKQGIMRHINARLTAIRPGYAEISLPYSDEVSQQHGFFHGGVVGTIAD